MSNENITLWIALITSLTTLFSVIAPFIYDHRKRKFEIKMRQIEFRQEKDYDAIESYIKAANICITRNIRTDEFAESSISICTHLNPSVWKYVFEINELVFSKRYEEAVVPLKSLCEEIYKESR